MLPVTPQESENGFELKKRVSWKGVFVREYNCTKGDHPLCSDNLPLSLDWSYSQDVKVKNIESSRERMSSYAFPKRLSYEDRKKRVFGDDSSTGSKDSQDSWQWATRPASLQGKKVQQKNLMDMKDETDEVEMDASRHVIFCRHVISKEEEEDDDDDDDSVNHFWRRFTGP